MRLLAKLVIGGLFGATAVSAGCHSEPLPKPDAQHDAIGGAGGNDGARLIPTGAHTQDGGAGGAGATATPRYVDVENDARCPDKDADWAKLDGRPCAENAADLLDCSKVWDCQPGNASYVDEDLFCYAGSWSWSSEKGSCDASKVTLGPDGCPTSDWSLAGGLPCPKEGVECSNPEANDCGVENAYYTEYVACHNRRWRWDFDEGDCEIGGAGGVGSTTTGIGGAGGAPP